MPPISKMFLAPHIVWNFIVYRRYLIGAAIDLDMVVLGFGY